MRHKKKKNVSNIEKRERTYHEKGVLVAVILCLVSQCWGIAMGF
jgi:hypothetical protein